MSIFITYAQNFEDVLLWRALKHIDCGFYIDIGAQDPVVDSVSKAFHERGWRGIHVEPTAAYAERLRIDRPDDIVIQAALSNEAGEMPFFEFSDTGMSTASRDIAERARAAGYPCDEISVPYMLLDDILERVDAPEIHWLKIDVEGYERQVLAGWRASIRRPWIVVVEATFPGTPIASHAQWEPILLEKGYVYAYADGLNRFYVSHEHADLLSHLTVGPNVFDAFQSSADHWSNQMLCQRHNERVGEFGAQMARMQAAHAAEQIRLQTDIAEARGRVAALNQNHQILAGNADGLVRDATLREQALKDELAAMKAAVDEAAHRFADRLADLEKDIGSKAAEIGQLHSDREQQSASLQRALHSADAAARRSESLHSQALSELQANWQARCDQLERELQRIRKSLGWRLASFFDIRPK